MAIIIYNITVFTVLCDNMNGIYIYIYLFIIFLILIIPKLVTGRVYLEYN